MALRFLHRVITSLEDATRNFEQLEQVLPLPSGPYDTGVLGGAGIAQFADVNTTITHNRNTTALTAWGHLYDGNFSSLASWRVVFPTANTVQVFIGNNSNKAVTAGVKFWLVG